jgi:putative endonuclease
MERLKDNSNLQIQGEDIAERLMKRSGFDIVHRNWRSKIGELDLVARRADLLVFVEVKTRSPGGLGHPAESVDHRKQRKLRLLAGAYIQSQRPRFEECRFDVISIVMTDPPQIEHFEAAFG